MTRARRIGLGLLFLLAGTAPSLAEIDLEEAAITGGQLVIAGRTAVPNQEVRITGTLFRMRSDETGAFRFEVAYLPPDCTVDLAAGADRLNDAIIGNCGPRGADGAAGPAGPQGPAGVGTPGPAGPAGP